MTFRVVAVGSLPPLELPTQQSADQDGSHAAKGTRSVFFNSRFQETTIYDGHKLQSGSRLQGPAIIEQRESTTVVLPQQQAIKGGQGEVLISAAGA